MMRYLQFAALLIVQAPLVMHAQVVRIGGSKPKPQLTLGDNLTVAATPAAVTFQLVSSGVAVASSPITVTTTWTGISLLSSLILYASFLDSTSALSGGTPIVKIPSSCVLGMDPMGLPAAFTPFTQVGPFGGAGGSLAVYSSLAILSLGGSHTDMLTLKINLATLPQLPSGTYRGLLSLQAQAF
jgi:hypothetical protein